jgi:hypothetical protein
MSRLLSSVTEENRSSRTGNHSYCLSYLVLGAKFQLPTYLNLRLTSSKV